MGKINKNINILLNEYSSLKKTTTWVLVVYVVLLVLKILNLLMEYNLI